MAIELWIGTEFTFSHERRALDTFVEKMKEQFKLRDETIFVLANYRLIGAQIDLTVIKRDAIIIIELKECTAPIEFSENGKWNFLNADGYLGNAKENPFQQATRYRETWIEFLGKNKGNITNKFFNYDHPKCMVCISPAIHPKSLRDQLPETLWFIYDGLNNAAKRIDEESCGFSFEEAELRKIIKILNLQPVFDPVLFHTFNVPFAKNQNFIGREQELAQIHELLQSKEMREPVLISGMSGVGKTQIAVQYAYKYRGAYPEGIYWINAAGNIQEEFARLANELDIKIASGQKDENIRKGQLARAFLERVNPCEDALLIFDNVEDLYQLYSPISNYIPANLNCRVLVTSTKLQPQLSLKSIILKPLPQQQSVELLLRGERHKKLLEDYLEDPELKSKDIENLQKLSNLLGNLPLALALSNAFLEMYPYISIEGYLERIRVEGGLAVGDLGLRAEDLPTRHNVVITTALQSLWNSIQSNDSKSILFAAALFHDAVPIPIPRLSLLTGISQNIKPGYPAPMAEALRELRSLSLIEDLSANQIRLHPLIIDFTKQAIIDQAEYELECVERIINSYWDPGILTNALMTRGVDAILDDLLVVKSFYDRYNFEDLPEYALLFQLVSSEAYQLRFFNITGLSNGFFIQQMRNRALELSLDSFRSKADIYISHNKIPSLFETFPIGNESKEVVQTITNKHGEICSLHFIPRSNLLLSAPLSGSALSIWDYRSGRLVKEIENNSFHFNNVVLSPDGEFAFCITRGKEGYEDGKYFSEQKPFISIWDIKDGKFVAVSSEEHWNFNGVFSLLDKEKGLFATNDHSLILFNFKNQTVLREVPAHSDTIIDICANEKKRIACSISKDGRVRVWDLDEFTELSSFQGPKSTWAKSEIIKNGRYIVCWHKDCNQDLSLVAMPRLNSKEEVKDYFTGRLSIWDIQDGVAKYELNSTPDIITKMLEDDHSWKMFAMQGLGSSFSYGIGPYKELLKVSSDERWILCHQLGGEFLLLDLKDKAGPSFLNIGNDVIDFSFSEDGRRAFFVCNDPNLITAYDFTTDLFKDFYGHLSKITALSVSQNDEYFASGSQDGEIKIWNLKPVQELQENNQVNMCKSKGTFSLDGKKIAFYIKNQRKVQLFELENALIKLINDLPLEGDLISMRFSLNGRTLLLETDSIRSIDIKTGELQAEYTYPKLGESWQQTFYPIEAYPGQIRALMEKMKQIELFDSDELAASKDRYSIYDLNQNKFLREVNGERCWIFTTKAGSLLATDANGRLCIFDIDSNELLNEFVYEKGDLINCVATKNGRFMACLYSDYKFVIWDLRTSSKKTEFLVNDHETMNLNIFSNGKNEFSLGEDGKILAFIADKQLYIWDIPESKLLAYLPGSFVSCDFSPNSDYLLVVDSFETSHLLELVNI